MNLNNIKLSQKFAKEGIHSINFENKIYSDFKATKFVYSMMTFNIIYDWNRNNGDRVWEKIEALVDYLFETNENLEFFYSTFKILNDKEADKNISVVIGISDDDNIKKVNNSDNIRPKRTYKKAFIDSFKNMNNNGEVTKEEVLMMILYLNQIRNNLFHGSKDIEHAVQSTQNSRLELYSEIILAVNDVFIKVKQSEQKV